MNTKLKSVHDAFGDIIGWGFQIFDDDDKIISTQGLFDTFDEAHSALKKQINKLTTNDKKTDTALRKLDKKAKSQYRKIFAERLRQARQATGLSQRAFAKKIGMSPTGYCQYENGQSDPNIPMLIQLSILLNCSLDWLFGRK